MAEAVLVEQEEVYIPPLYELRTDILGASPAAVKKVEEWLEKNRECMALLEEGLQKSDYRIDADYSNPLNVEWPNLLHNRRFMELYLARALLAARAGRGEEAFEWCGQSIRLGRTLNTIPMIISQMIHESSINLSLDCLESLFELYQPEPEVCQALLAELELLDPLGDANLALEGERCLGNVVFETLKDASDSQTAERTMKCGITIEPPWYPDAFIDLEQALYLERMAVGLDAFRTPQVMLKGTFSWDEIYNDIPWYSPGYWFSDFSFYPNLESFLKTTCFVAARVGLARVALNLIQHKIKHGALPETRDVLEETLLGKLPLDPYTDSPFHYVKCADGGFLLYSVGENLVDDKGEEGEKPIPLDIVFTWSPPGKAEK
jgi:hypothetical protein